MDSSQQRILTWIGVAIALLLVVLLVVLLTGGDSTTAAADSTTATDGDTSTTSSEATTTSSEATTTTAAVTSSSSSTTTTAATTTTTAPSGACAALPSATIPGPEPGTSFAIGDFDGDGSDDQLIGYEDAGGTWWVQIALSYGYATETAVPGPVTAIGATDLGGGQDVGYAQVDSGASVSLIGFFFLPGCDVFEATVNTGAVARFPVGGGVMHLDGLRCDADAIVTKSATTNDGITWEYSEARWQWVPGLLEFQMQSSSIALLTSPADDAVIFDAGSMDCPDTSL